MELAEQSGNVASVGFELFCGMLDEAVHELQGDVVAHEVDPEISCDEGALLPEDYIQDVGCRLSFYKRLASAGSVDDVQDLAGEMEDRFGPPPDEARQLVHLMRLKTELRRLRALACEVTTSLVTVHLRDDTPLDPAKLMKLMSGKASPYKLSPDMRLSRRSREIDAITNGLDAADRVLRDLSTCLRDGA